MAAAGCGLLLGPVRMQEKKKKKQLAMGSWRWIKELYEIAISFASRTD